LVKGAIMDIQNITSLFICAYEKQDNIVLSQLLTKYATQPLHQIKVNLKNMGQFFDNDTKIKDVAELIVDDSSFINNTENNAQYKLPFETELVYSHQLVSEHYEQSSIHSDNLQNNLIDIIELRKIIFNLQEFAEIKKFNNTQAVISFNLKFLTQLNELEKLVIDSLAKINFILNNDLLLINKIDEIKKDLPNQNKDSSSC
jgi:hypothetical protein